MKSKKIALLYDFFSEHGGIERIMLFQARALKSAGHEVSFAFAYVDEDLAKERLSGFKVIEYGKLPVKNETVQICASILRKNLKEKLKFADLIICHSFPASYIATKVKKHFNSKFIFHLHHPPQFLYSGDFNWSKNSFKRKFSYFAVGKAFGFFWKKLDSYCVRKADDYFAESSAVKKIVDDCYAINSTILYPTVDRKFKIIKTNLSELKKFGINKDFILGSGRIIYQKRFDYLIDAYSKLKNREDLQLVLVGKYDELTKAELEKLAKEKNIKILFLGAVEIEDLIKLYNLAKVTVLTCPKEWFGLVPIEAMACGCPVVSWKDNFGPQESITEGESGFLAKPYSIDSLAEKIQAALERRWNPLVIAGSVGKFSEEEQGKVLLKKI